MLLVHSDHHVRARLSENAVPAKTLHGPSCDGGMVPKFATGVLVTQFAGPYLAHSYITLDDI